MKKVEKQKILFLCTGNSCRSQMAEGFGRQLLGDTCEVYSAGIEAHGLNPYAIKVMAEAGVDISTHNSTLLDEFKGIEFDLVITVCGHADEQCPLFSGKTVKIHHGFPDPPRLAKGLADEERVLDCYRQVRDNIRAYIVELKAGGLKENS
ncbi:MAG: arsenate reductase ArsC [Thermodesulfobacteriota bacterium]